MTTRLGVHVSIHQNEPRHPLSVSSVRTCNHNLAACGSEILVANILVLYTINV